MRLGKVIGLIGLNQRRQTMPDIISPAGPVATGGLYYSNCH